MTATTGTAQKLPFHVLNKPIGPICNIECDYCFYLEKEQLYAHKKKSDFRMSEEVLEQHIKQYFASQPGPNIEFAWQGGEPTLMGLDFFKKAADLQQKYKPEGWTVTSTMQTNGMLLTPEWCEFLRENNFLIGISIDGPADVHDCYRVDKRREPTHEKVMKGLRLLQEHKVEYNILCVVNDVNGKRPVDVYNFFKDAGAEFLQFIPIVEHLGDGKVTDRSVPPEEYGIFLREIFDEWIRKDVGKIYVQIFEECFKVWLGYPAGLCIFRETCGDATALEHNGDLYACDHYVFDEYRLGNIMDTDMSELVFSPQQRKFATDKRDLLPKFCRECDVKFMCNGGCPKNRIRKTPDGEDGLNYLCAGYKIFFHHIDPYLQKMAEYFQRQMPPAMIMEHLKQQDQAVLANTKRNDPCPCGSGKKFKLCCMSKLVEYVSADSEPSHS